MHCWHFDAAREADYNSAVSMRGRDKHQDGDRAAGVVVERTLAPGSASGGLAGGGGRLRGLHGLRIARGKAFTPVVGNRAIDDRTAVDALPCVEDQKEVGKPLEHHEPFALRTFHRILPGCDAQLGRSKARAEPIFVDT